MTGVPAGKSIVVPGMDSVPARASLDAPPAYNVAQSLGYTFAQHPRVLVQKILVHPVKRWLPRGRSGATLDR
jgi:hypothetical protein